tara:strand:+ start:6516 stop:7109 length:594 start_codon:yes stop_codon:yes gene_type:complete
MKYKKFYDELYENGYHKSLHGNHGKVLLPKVLQYDTDLFVLDLGCSKGKIVESLINKGFKNTYGIDIADIAIEACRNRGLETCTVASCSQTGFEDSFFDIVISSDVLEHIDQEELPSVAKEVNRIMKIGGIFYFKIATKPERHVPKYKKIAQKYNLKNLHVTVKPVGFWKKLFISNGFRVATLSKNKRHLILKGIKE